MTRFYSVAAMSLGVVLLIWAVKSDVLVKSEEGAAIVADATLRGPLSKSFVAPALGKVDCDAAVLANPFGNAQTPCTEKATATMQHASDPGEKSSKELLDKFVSDSGRADLLTLTEVIRFAENCKLVDAQSNQQNATICEQFTTQKVYAIKLIEQLVQGGHANAQYRYGSLLQMDATSDPTLDPVARQAKYKRGEALIQAAAKSGNPEALEIVNGIWNFQEQDKRKAEAG